MYLNQETVKCLVGDRGLGVASRVVISTARAQAGKGMPTFRSTNGKQYIGSNHTQKMTLEPVDYLGLPITTQGTTYFDERL